MNEKIMDKFKAVVNGVSYDTEEEYEKAILSAFAIGKVNATYSWKKEEKKSKESSYKITEEDIKEIKEFNKNLKALHIKIPNLPKVLKTFDS